MIKKLILVLFAAVFLMVGTVFVGATVCASAEEIVSETPVTEPVEEGAEQPEDGQEGAADEVPEAGQDAAQDGENEGMVGLVEGFISQLKDRYGGQWQEYYNAILSEWGTVEEYLLSLVPENSPDVVKDGWSAFVGWTRENWVVLAAIGATICVLIIVVFGKKIFDAVKKFFASVFKSTNKQYGVLIAQNNAFLALMGDNPKFEAQRAALQDANEEMMKDEE